MKVSKDQELTKADLEMAVFLSAGEVDRYRIMLEHDIRAFELLDPDRAKADTVVLARSGLLDVDGVGLKHLAKGYDFSGDFKVYPTWEYFPDHSGDVNLSASVRSCERDSGEIRHNGDVQAHTDETSTLYDRPEM